ncbi:MAG TPA: ATP-dependent protease subunit HslV [bacterium (Candidatus Stahlbacteria)]|nr:ATP-dependent protease subunit HslV [Candidatus Stahlbacteria bacterium]
MKQTTILGLRKDGRAVIGSDGQVTIGETIMKHRARKIRKMYQDRVLVGFAGAAADAFTLFERFEAKLDQFRGNLKRSVYELAKEWRSDRVLRRLEALLAILDREHTYIVSGSGDIIEPEDGIIAIGSGGPYALAACRAMVRFSDLSPREIVEYSIQIAGELSLYSNIEVFVEEL